MDKKAWGGLSSALSSILTKIIVGLILKVAGFKAWVISLLVEKTVDHVLIPAIQLAMREGKLLVRVRRGKVSFKELEQAKLDGDELAYNAIIDSI